MKKILLIILILSLSTLSAIDMNMNLGVMSDSNSTPIYAEIGLTQTLDKVTLRSEYTIGHDISNNIAFNSMKLSFILSFDWGDVILARKFGSGTESTEFRLEF